MSQALADSLRGEHCIAINDCYKLAPWADALVAQDHNWWNVHPDAKQFAGRKFSANKIPGIEQVYCEYIQRQSSSGVLGLEVARSRYFAKEIDLYGFDMRGDHYFGKHPMPLHNTTPARYEVFQQQFAAAGEFLAKCGVRVVNRTHGSALRAFPIVLN